VTRGCGIAPILANRAALVVNHDEESIFRAMERVLGEPGLHTHLAAGCLEVTSRLGWEDPAGAMEILYGRLVDAACGGGEPRVIIGGPEGPSG